MKKSYLVGLVILVLVLGYLCYLSFRIAANYCVTVSEFTARSAEYQDTPVRVVGEIADSPIDWNAEDVEMRFTITEGGDTLVVVYHGPEPSGFKVGSSILVEGKYDADGMFQASQLIMKCPSKYEPEE